MSVGRGELLDKFIGEQVEVRVPASVLESIRGELVSLEFNTDDALFSVWDEELGLEARFMLGRVEWINVRFHLSELGQVLGQSCIIVLSKHVSDL